MGAQLVVNNLACKRGQRLLFRDLTFTVQRGELLQIAGKNGVGKTTLLRALSGLLLPHEGTICWRDQCLADMGYEYGQQVAYVGHQLGLKADLTVAENLKWSVWQTGAVACTLQDVLQTVDMLDKRDVLLRTLSAGQKRRVALARLLLMSKPLWLLDEPFTALDESGVQVMQQALIQHVVGGGVVVLSSHQALNLPHAMTKRLTLGDLACCN